MIWYDMIYIYTYIHHISSNILGVWPSDCQYRGSRIRRLGFDLLNWRPGWMGQKTEEPPGVFVGSSKAIEECWPKWGLRLMFYYLFTKYQQFRLAYCTNLGDPDGIWKQMMLFDRLLDTLHQKSAVWWVYLTLQHLCKSRSQAQRDSMSISLHGVFQSWNRCKHVGKHLTCPTCFLAIFGRHFFCGAFQRFE